MTDTAALESFQSVVGHVSVSHGSGMKSLERMTSPHINLRFLFEMFGQTTTQSVCRRKKAKAVVVASSIYRSFSSRDFFSFPDGKIRTTKEYRELVSLFSWLPYNARNQGAIYPADFIFHRIYKA